MPWIIKIGHFKIFTLSYELKELKKYVFFKSYEVLKIDKKGACNMHHNLTLFLQTKSKLISIPNEKS